MNKTTSKIASLCAGALALIGVNSAAVAQDGMIAVPSSHDVATTMDKLESVLKSKGMTIMARVDHTANAANVDLELRPTQLLIFGNPKVGTQLMQCSQSIAIDLPLKMLAYQAEDGQVFLAYNDPAYLKARHATQGCDAVFETVSGALGNFAKAATGS